MELDVVSKFLLCIQVLVIQMSDLIEKPTVNFPIYTLDVV